MPDLSSWQTALPHLIMALAFGYLLGSVPFGLIFSRMAGLGDIRSIGSGSIGATNVLRSGKKGVAAATLIADFLKGAIPVLIAAKYGIDFALMAGLGAFLGHCLPVWLKFKGGKGVATYIGILAALSLKTVLVFAVVWLSTAAITRYSSLSSMLASASIPVALFWMGDIQSAELFTILTVLVWIFHHANIKRLLAGSESRIGDKG